MVGAHTMEESPGIEDRRIAWSYSLGCAASARTPTDAFPIRCPLSGWLLPSPCYSILLFCGCGPRSAESSGSVGGGFGGVPLETRESERPTTTESEGDGGRVSDRLIFVFSDFECFVCSLSNAPGTTLECVLGPSGPEQSSGARGVRSRWKGK